MFLCFDSCNNRVQNFLNFHTQHHYEHIMQGM